MRADSWNLRLAFGIAIHIERVRFTQNSTARRIARGEPELMEVVPMMTACATNASIMESSSGTGNVASADV